MTARAATSAIQSGQPTKNPAKTPHPSAPEANDPPTRGTRAAASAKFKARIMAIAPATSHTSKLAGPRYALPNEATMYMSAPTAPPTTRFVTSKRLSFCDVCPFFIDEYQFSFRDDYPL